MIDTIELRLKADIDDGFLAERKPGENFYSESIPDFEFVMLTAHPNSPYAKIDKHRMLVEASDLSHGIKLHGPHNETSGKWECRFATVHLRRLLGWPPGWLPADEADVLRAFAEMRKRLNWLPYGTLERAIVKRLHLTMNFDFTKKMSTEDLIASHTLVRHKRIRKDPLKWDPEHSSLYWMGSRLDIVMYEKTQQVVGKYAKYHKMEKSEVRRLHPMNDLVRIEFRVKEALLSDFIDRVSSIPAPSAGEPPIQKIGKNVRLAFLNARIATDLYRKLISEFGSPPIRKVQNLTGVALLAMLMKERATLADGTPVVDFAARFISATRLNHAKKEMSKIDTGGSRFDWNEILGSEGYGPFAVPKPEQYKWHP